MTAIAEIRFREAEPGDFGARDDGQPFGLPADVLASLDEILGPYGLTGSYVLGSQEHEFRQQGLWPWALIFFGDEHALSGHVASLRGGMWNSPIFSYSAFQRHKAGVPPAGIPSVGALCVRKKAILKRLAEQSPLFRPAWDALKDAADDARWLCLSDPPPPAWVAEAGPGDAALFREYSSRSLLIQLRPPSAFANADLAAAYQLGVESCQSGAWERGLANLKVASELDPKAAEIWHCLGLAHGALGDPDSAIAALARAAELQPYWLATILCLSYAYRNRGFYSQSEAGYLRAVEIDPFVEDGWYGLGVTCAEAGRNAQAVAAYSRLLELEPRSGPGWTEYGQVLFRSGRVAEAASAFEKRVEFEPGNVMGWNNLGYCRARLGRCEEAREALEKALQLDPTASYAWDSLGYAHLMAARYEPAIAACLKAIELRPEHPDAWRHMVHAYSRSGNERKLASALAYLKSMNPGEAEKTERELAGATIE